MAAHDRVSLLLPLLLTVACASTSRPAPQTGAAVQPSTTPPQTITAPPSPAPATTEEPVAAPVRGTKPIVIDEGTDESSAPPTLAAAAAAERERRRDAPPPVLVVNNKNLADNATGKLSFSQAPAPAAEAPPATDKNRDKDERYWRDRVRGLRQQWALAVDAITELENRAAGLRTRFYSQDDPYVRDGEVKPAWDRALDNLESARKRARDLEDALAEALEEGRQAGALPGWLRDGIELEPKEHPYTRPDHKVAPDDANIVREPEDLGKPPQR